MCFSVPLCAAEPVIEPSMVIIKAGQFMMGSRTPTPAQRGAPSDGPMHQVDIKAFELSKYELTVKQFRQFVEATGYVPVGLGETKDGCWKYVKPVDGGAPIAVRPGRWNTPEHAPSDYHPVMCVSWDDAQAYVRWLSGITGTPYRLPSEAEWEYAARAGSAAASPAVDDGGMCRYANIFDQSGQAAFARDLGWDREATQCDDMAETTSVVGMYEANAFGLHDMLGNVAEYVEDCEHSDYVGAPADGSPWTRDCDTRMGDGRIRRGEAYGGRAELQTFSRRGHAGRTNHSSLGEGIRIARDITGNAEGAARPSPFELELAKAQAIERERRADTPAKGG